MRRAGQGVAAQVARLQETRMEAIELQNQFVEMGGGDRRTVVDARLSLFPSPSPKKGRSGTDRTPESSRLQRDATNLSPAKSPRTPRFRFYDPERRARENAVHLIIQRQFFREWYAVLKTVIEARGRARKVADPKPVEDAVRRLLGTQRGSPVKEKQQGAAESTKRRQKRMFEMKKRVFDAIREKRSPMRRSPVRNHHNSADYESYDDPCAIPSMDDFRRDEPIRRIDLSTRECDDDEEEVSFEEENY